MKGIWPVKIISNPLRFFFRRPLGRPSLTCGSLWKIGGCTKGESEVGIKLMDRLNPVNIYSYTKSR